jgi:NADH-quinone oxidoreductase subunit L
VIQDLAAGLGALTLLMAGLIALVQVDIKRVIAYSTMSQIGYMFVGVGVGSYANGLFHLMTHAFFKALLFLAAGLAIHAIAGEQDIRRLAGIGKLMPQTKWVFLIGSLALVGIPPFAGFFSKDSIIAATLARGDWFGYLLFAATIAGALLTGIYAFRLYFIVFTGEPTAFAREHYHAHHGAEGPLSMRWTVGVLAVLSTIGGFLQFAPVWHPFSDWLAPVLPSLVEPTNTQEAVASIVAVLVGVAGIAVSWWIYAAHRAKAPKAVPAFEHKFYWDELYDRLFYYPTDLLARGLYTFVEQPIIAGSLTSLTGFFGTGSQELGRAQNGLVRTYALALAGSVAVLAVVFLSVR